MSDLKLTVEPGSLAIIITRTFEAPRELVFKAHTDPDAIPQWWGPERYSTEIDRMEPKPGGSWRFVSRDADGNEFAFRGVYHEVKSPELIVQTFEFEPYEGHVSLEVLRLQEDSRRTLYTATTVFETLEDRDGMVESGMESGMRESHERLDRLLKTMK